jgi:hypothetical protein
MSVSALASGSADSRRLMKRRLIKGRYIATPHTFRPGSG